MIPKRIVALPASVCSIIAAAPHALIGGHAVNMWVTPRYTHDFDVTIAADLPSLLRIETRLRDEGFAKTDEHSGRLPSGPDFHRRPDGASGSNRNARSSS
jgi:hypothetical protein